MKPKGVAINGGDVEPKEVFTPEANVKYMLKNVNSGLYMEVADAKAFEGANVQQWGADAPADHNTWTFTQATGNYYYIKSALDGGNKWYLYVNDGSRENGGNLVVAEKNGYSDQFFQFFHSLLAGSVLLVHAGCCKTCQHCLF